MNSGTLKRYWKPAKWDERDPENNGKQRDGAAEMIASLAAQSNKRPRNSLNCGAFSSKVARPTGLEPVLPP